MCGRYQLTLPLEAVREIFDVWNEAEAYPPRYNIAPTQPIHVVCASREGRTLILMRWGLLPSWLKDPQKFPLLINARSETAAEKPAFRNALRRRRALIPATGFYEWRKEGAAKQPYYFEPAGPMAFAGIWEAWTGPNGEEMDTAAILTAAAEGVPAQYHERMPLTIRQENFAAWLDPDQENGADALKLTEKASYAARPVSRRLSNARHEGVALMEPDPEPASASQENSAQEAEDEEQPSLF
ncbi:MAG: SOS response-associated peptidase [Pseudomonadota bacterium]